MTYLDFMDTVLALDALYPTVASDRSKLLLANRDGILTTNECYAVEDILDEMPARAPKTEQS